MRKLLLILLATALTGSFTSCVENQIPDEVVKIYDNQAEVLAAQAALLQAQAAVQAANVAYVAAQAEYERGRAAYQNALASQAQANADKILADIAIANAKAAQELQQAIESWQIEMKRLQAILVQTQNTAINGAYNAYIMAKGTLDNFMANEINKQKQIADQMRILTDRTMTNASAYAGLEADLASEEAELAMLNVMLADYQAMIAAGSSLGDRLAARDMYEAQVESKNVEINNLKIAIDQSTEKISQLEDARDATGYDDVMTDYANLQSYHTVLINGGVYNGDNYDSLETLRTGIPTKKTAISNEQDDIDDYEAILADYAAYVAGLEAKKTAAETAETAAIAAEATAIANVTAATTAKNNATQAKNDANTAKTTLQNKAAISLVTLQNAVSAYQTALAGVVDTTVLEGLVTAAEADLPIKQTAYDNAKINFEDKPNATTWVDGGADGRLGNHDDDGVSTETYAEILSVAGVNPNQTATFGAVYYTSVADVVAATEVITGNTWQNFTLADVGLFFDIENDDVAPLGDNAFVFNQASSALDAAKLAISTAKTNEEAISGITSGLINLGESVTWKAKHLGFTQKLTTKITQFNSPDYFVDEMTKGAFKSFKHEHSFREKNGVTVMIDKFDYKSPFGMLGKLVDYIFLKKYMTKFLTERNQIVKEFAETEKWKEVLLL